MERGLYLKQKRILDLIMLVLLLMAMAYPKTAPIIHEMIGISLGICFVIHHLLNHNWYRSVFKGKYPVLKKIYIAINFLLLIDILLIMLSGLTMSQLLPTFNFMSFSLARTLHLVFAYWGFILMAVHLGLHIQAMLRPIKKRFKNKSVFVYHVIPYGLVIIGIVLFIKNQLISYLLMLSDYVFIDETTGLFQYIIEYLGMFSSFVILTYYIIKNIKK